MPKPDGSLSAVIVSGGKQYRVAPGDQILVDRLKAEPGSSLKLDRVLLFNHGGEIKVGSPAVDGLDVEVKVLAHRRGPRVESLRYKSKKRVRVHHGGRADLTALQIIAVGGLTGKEEEEEAAKAQETKRQDAKPKSRGRAKTKTAPVKAEAAEKEEAPAKPARRAPKQETKK